MEKEKEYVLWVQRGCINSQLLSLELNILHIKYRVVNLTEKPVYREYLRGKGIISTPVLTLESKVVDIKKLVEDKRKEGILIEYK